MSYRRRRVPRVLAVASSGGHWLQLKRLRKSWIGCEVHLATNCLNQVIIESDWTVHQIPDGSRKDRLGLIRTAVTLHRLVKSLRPDVVVTTGAAPGLVALAAGKLSGARCIWLDSIANTQRLSLSGRLARPFADLWLTQWPQLSKPSRLFPFKRPQYLGAVL